MPLSKKILAQLQNPDATIRARAVLELLAAHDRHELRAVENLAEAAALLGDRSDWSAVLTVTEAALHDDLPDEALAEWLVQKAWCLFWLNRPAEAWEILTNARETVERHPDPDVRRRLYLVSGYVLDVRGAHAQALGWYGKALMVADADTRPAVLLEMGTSLSKQGLLIEAIARFDEALSLLREGDPKHARLRVHILSRSAVVEENLGDLTEALHRHDAAVAAVVGDGDPQLAFETNTRRARTHLAHRDFDRATADLDAAEAFAPIVRRGTLQLTHDRARLARARGNFPEALDKYLTCVRLLPDAHEILSTYSDIWGEILDGLIECLRQTNGRGVEVVEAAREELQALRARPDIYGGQAVTERERRARAVTAADQVRELLLGAGNTVFVAAGHRFDLTGKTAARVSSEGGSIPLDDGDCYLLLTLFEAPGQSASVAIIRSHFKKKGVSAPSPEALRQMVGRLRKKLGLGPQELLQGKRGAKGGGYTLILNK